MAHFSDDQPVDISPALGVCFAFFACAAIALLAGSSGASANTLQTSAIISVCGNGVVDPGEVCDDGLVGNTGAYGSTTAERHCEPGCQSFGPYCGDGVLQVRFTEQCDQGSANGTGGLCSLQCQSLPPAPPASPSGVNGSTPYVSGAVQGAIPSITQTQVVLHGKAYPSATVNVLVDGTQVGTVLADTNADFLYTTTNVAPGTETFSFWAKDSSGVASIITSVVFNVVQSAVTSVSNVFLPPTISSNAQKIAPGGLLTLSGQSVPTAKVTTYLDSDTSGALASTADGGGQWALQLNTASITGGFHSAKANFTLASSTVSGFGKSISFFVGNQLPAGGTSPDVNGDGKINLVDFSIFLLSWGTSDVREDFNQDGTVNLADFSILLFNWTG